MVDVDGKVRPQKKSENSDQVLNHEGNQGAVDFSVDHNIAPSIAYDIWFK